MAALGDGALSANAGLEQGFHDAVDDQIRVAADRRGKVRVAGRGQGKMAFVRLGVAGLTQRAKHEIAQNSLLGLALDARGQLLIHARSDGDIFGDLMGASGSSGAMRVAAVSPGLDAPDRQRAEAQRVTEAGGQFLELDDAAGLGLLVNSVERGHAEILGPGGDALVGGQHELFNEAIGPSALGLGHAAHLPLLIELDHRLGKIEIDAAALRAAPIHQQGELLHAFEAGNECGVAGADGFVALQNRVDLGIGHARGRADHALDDLVAENAAGRIELHQATEHEPVFARTKAANAG